MQEFINGLVLIEGKLVKKNFLIKEDKIYFEYEPTKNPIDISNLVVSPSFWDLHTHTRVPGYEYKEDIVHVTNAAIRGGYSHIVAMGNTNPMPNNVDNYKLIKKIVNQSKINIFQVARVTNKEEIVDFASLRKLTSIFSDDGFPICDKNLMLQALRAAKENNCILMLHEEDEFIKGHAYTSRFTKKYHIRAFDHKYESNMVKRDLELNKEIGAKIHLQHISTKESIKIIKKINQSWLSFEVSPHHLFFSNKEIDGSTNFKMNPPLGSRSNQKFLIHYFKKGLIKIVATDHAPHVEHEKGNDWIKSANGVIGLETAFSVLNTLFGPKYLVNVLESLSINPAKLLGYDVSLKNGGIANIVFIDSKEKWIVDSFESKSQNSPWIGKELIGRVKELKWIKM